MLPDLRIEPTRKSADSLKFVRLFFVNLTCCCGQLYATTIRPAVIRSDWQGAQRQMPDPLEP